MWKKLSSKVLFEHPRITLVEDSVRLPSGHEIEYLRWENICDAVTIICRKNNKILLEQEYSYPVNAILWQFPGGKVDGNERPIDAANRELMEEVGYRANELIPLGKYLISNRRTDAYMHVFLAKNLVEQSLNSGDIEETIEKKWLLVDEIKQLIASNEIVNPHALSSWCLYENSQYAGGTQNK